MKFSLNCLILTLTLGAVALSAIGCGGAGGGEGGSTGGGGTGSGGNTGGTGGTPLTITTITPLPRAEIGQPYNFTLQASGGTPPYVWTLVPGQGFLPGGLPLSATGTISGTPSQLGLGGCSDVTPTIQVQDAKGTTTSARLEILCIFPLAFADDSHLGTGNVGIPYSAGVNAQGGVPPYSYSLVGTSAPFPTGLSFVNQPSNGGIIQGLPSAPGDVSVTIKVVDNGTPQLSATQGFDLNIANNLIVAPSGIPVGVQNVPYSEQVQVVGGTPPYHWSAQNILQKLPVGLSLDPASGIIHGIPTVTGISGFGVLVADSTVPTPATMNGSLQFIINPSLKLDTTSAHDGTNGRGYSINFQLEGGRPPYNATILGGSLPDNVTIQPGTNNFDINAQGTPTKDGLSQFTMKFADSYETPNVVTQDYQIRISEPLAMSTPSSGPLLEGQPYAGNFMASGGFPPYSWSANNVPAGLNFDTNTGAVSGVAGPLGPGVVEGSESMFVTLQDSSNPPFTMSMFWNLEVIAKLRIETSFFPAVGTGSSIWLTPAFDGGIFPITWTITSGSLPPGTSFSTKDGTISGTPSIAGSYPFTLSLSDSNQPPFAQVASKSFTLVVKDRSQLTRNDTISQATPISNGSIVASISPFSDTSTNGPDVDVYQMTALPGALVDLLAEADVIANQHALQNSMFPVLEVVGQNGTRFQTCSRAVNQGTFNVGPYNFPCINGLDGNFFSSGNYTFQVPGVGTTPVTFYVRVLDARGDARPDFIYTLVVSGAN